MKNRAIVFVLCVLMAFAAAISVLAAQNEEDIIILYENDVHCAVDGYSKLSAMKNELSESYKYVGVVSSGDYIQGGSISTISRGEYIVRLMNIVGYDAVTLGNHEFDFKLDRLQELIDMMNVKPVCCNFEKLGENAPFFKPYTIVSYGDVDVAYIGITTPATVTASSPGQFKDEEGNFIYTFHPEDLAVCVQSYVDAAISEGADYVIALSHLGDSEPKYNLHEIVGDLYGIDVFLDAHSHSVIESKIYKDKNGEDVIVSSTGTKFEYIGKLTISNGTITTELISTESYTKTDEKVDACLASINEEYLLAGERKVAYSEVELITHDSDGNRLVRVGETNLGNLCADACRIMLGADIAYTNGGGIRAPIAVGDVTLNDLFDLFPYNNSPVMIEVKGQAIKDLLELTTSDWPLERGGFPHVSGLTFSLDTSIESSVVLDENEMFERVDGEYRVYDIRVLNKESGEYEELELDKTYTLAGQNHSLLEGGGGISMFKDAPILVNNGELDVEMLEAYITEHLGGVIGEQYATVQPHITFTDGKLLPAEPEVTEVTEATEVVEDTSDSDEQANNTWVIVVCVVCTVAVILAAVVIVKKTRAEK